MAAPVSIEKMLDPMKRRKICKGQCQSEPWDLSVHRSDMSEDVSQELGGNDSGNIDTDVTETDRNYRKGNCKL